MLVDIPTVRSFSHDQSDESPDYSFLIESVDSRITARELACLLLGLDPRRHSDELHALEATKQEFAGIMDMLAESLRGSDIYSNPEPIPRENAYSIGRVAKRPEPRGGFLNFVENNERRTSDQNGSIERSPRALDDDAWQSYWIIAKDGLNWAIRARIAFPWEMLLLAWQKGILDDGNMPSEKELAVFDQLAARPHSLDELQRVFARQSGYSPSTLRRILRKLRSYGLVLNDPNTGYYRPDHPSAPST